jgi:hypothetical protein
VKIFKRKKRIHDNSFYDLNNNLLHDGDIVRSDRYNLGECRIIVDDGDLKYLSLETGDLVHWTRMIDAITGRQKVYKVNNL